MSAAAFVLGFFDSCEARIFFFACAPLAPAPLGSSPLFFLHYCFSGSVKRVCPGLFSSGFFLREGQSLSQSDHLCDIQSPRSFRVRCLILAGLGFISSFFFGLADEAHRP